MKKLLFFAILISSLTLAGFWGGKKMCMLMWPGSVNPSQSWYFNLGLNNEQAESLKKMDFAFREKTDKICMRICKERIDLLNMMRNSKADPEAIYKKIEEIGTVQISLEKEIATHILQVKKDLTPEQSEAYLNKIREELRLSMKQSGYNEVLN